MFNKNIEIFCNYNDNLQVQKVMENYNSRGARIIDMQEEVVRLTLCCSIFKIKEIKHDIKLLNDIGIKVEISIK